LSVAWTPPAEFDGLKIVRPLGQGGHVYLGHDTILDRAVALKFIAVDQRHPAMLARFLVEARTLAGLWHPNIVAVFRVGEVEGRPFLAYELVKGKALDQLTVPMPWRRAVSVASGIVRGLAAAHERGILHRDITPGNVMLGEDGDVKLIDFGLAESGVGTPGFVAPELLQGKPASAQSDIYSLGMLLSWLCTGTLAASALPAGIPPGLASVITRCIDPAPEQRFDSALELLQALDTLAQTPAAPTIAVEVPTRSAALEALIELQTTAQHQLYRGLCNARPVVVKTVRAHRRDARNDARLRREHALLAALDVRGVVKSLGLVQLNDGAALLLEDAGPHSLDELMHRGPGTRLRMDVGTFLELAVPIVAAVAAVHERSIIHRDLCPANIVVGHHGEVTLIDFELATTVAAPTQSLVEPDTSAGALPYQAPELSGCVRRVVDHRADLYALGATFYEMLTGAPPVAGAEAPPAIIPDMPPVLSELVLRLLAKLPESRYQTAEALHADLAEAQRQWLAGSTIAPFSLGRRDWRPLRMPARLYGRERELALLAEGVAASTAGANQLVVIKGVAGVGKSALVDELRLRALAGMRFAVGKCDQLVGDSPFAPFIAALRGLVQTLLDMPAPAIAQLRRRIADAIAPNGRILTDLVPELEELLGAQPALAPSGLGEAARRAERVLSGFVRALATAEQPLALFIDDVQWADPASLQLVRTLVAAPDLRHLLVILAWRSDEVGAEHVAAQTVRELRSGGAPLHELELLPIDEGAVAALLAEALGCGVDEARPLAQITVDKTAGNPLFVQRFLRSLQESGELVFAVGTDRWTWEARHIAAVAAPANVVALLLTSLRGHAPETQAALQLAACIGQQLDLELLARLLEQDGDAVARALQPAVENVLVVPLRAAGQYQFSHDCVQEAAYSLLSDEPKLRMHLAIGRRLTEAADEHAPAEILFRAVDQLNRASNLIPTESERLRLVELNERAAGKARAASAYAAARAYLRRAVELLPADVWRTRHELAFRLHQSAAELAFTAGATREGQALADAALAQLLSRLETATLYATLADGYRLAAERVTAIAWAEKGLSLYDLRMPADADLPAAIAAAYAAVEAKLRACTPELLLDSAPASDPEALVLQKILVGLALSEHPDVEQEGHLLLVLWAVRAVLQEGHTVHSATAYMLFARMLAAREDYARAHVFGRLGLELAQRCGDRAVETANGYYFATYISHWGAPLRLTPQLLQTNIGRGIESGALVWASYCRALLAFTHWTLGSELDRVAQIVDDGLSFCQRLGSPVPTDMLIRVRQAIRCLKGSTAPPGSFEDAECDASGCDASLRLQVSFLLRDFAGALEQVERIEHGRAFAAPWAPRLEQVLYTALTLAAVADEHEGTARAQIIARIKGREETLHSWADACPDNFRHRHALVAAELARLEGDGLAAESLYTRAINGAIREGFVQDQAVAHEHAARFYLASGQRQAGSEHLAAAIDAYTRWGASAKVQELEHELGSAGLAIAERSRAVAPSREETDETELDLVTLIKTVETLSGEIALDRLLERMLRISVEAAGAERAALVLEDGGVPVVRALASPSGEIALVHVPLAAQAELPISVIEAVRRDGKMIVLGDAAQEGDFIADRDIAARHVKSIMAAPMQRQGRLVGVLYFENNLVTNVFLSPTRARLFELLSTQIAISLENSLLFEEQARVAAIASFLADTGAILAESLDYRVTLTKVARLAVPFLADWCLVDVIEDGIVRRVAGTHVNPARQGQLAELAVRYPVTIDSPQPAGHALRTGQAQLTAELTEAAFAGFTVDAAHAQLMRALGVSSMMAVPLIVRGQILGAITLVSAQATRRYAASDLATAKELARRAALAIDNARLYRESRDAARKRDEFLALASHELRTPLTSLQLAVQRTLLRPPEDTPSTEHTLTTVKRQTDRLGRIIGELLSVARIQSGKVMLQLETVDLTAMVREQVARFAEQLRRAGCDLSLHASGPVVGTWDRRALEEIVASLLDNAIKFGAGGIIDVSIDGAGGVARLVVADRGAGIPAERLPHIFDPFERAVSFSHYAGLGLGLFIVKRLVEAMSGTVRAENGPQAGATFTVELPLGGRPLH
jgi:predicted ATPase/serine/threonine protein kinase/signal transduction histidine kinase